MKTTIQSLIDNLLLKENEIESKKHISSNKLTAGFLYQSKRFQLLKYLGVEKKQLDPFTLRKFERGKDIEKSYLRKLKAVGILKDKQKEVEYRGVIGVVDAIVDHKKLNDNLGIVPHEVKSVTNRNFSYLKKRQKVSRNHSLQAGFYALALKKEFYSVDYIASDDGRELIIPMRTENIKLEIDIIINEFEEMIKNKTVPDWKVSEKWQNIPQYMAYSPIWATLNANEFRNKLESIGKEWKE